MIGRSSGSGEGRQCECNVKGPNCDWKSLLGDRLWNLVEHSRGAGGSGSSGLIEDVVWENYGRGSRKCRESGIDVEQSLGEKDGIHHVIYSAGTE